MNPGLLVLLVVNALLVVAALVARLRGPVVGSWFRRGSVAADSSTATRPPAPAPKAEADDFAAMYAKLRKFETDLAASDRDRADFEEMVKRWMGRTNRQESRDRATAAAVVEDPEQIDFTHDLPRAIEAKRASSFNAGRPALRAKAR